MSERGATAKQRHRAQAFDLARGDDGLVRCVLRGMEGHECAGRLQAHHAIPVQTLKRLHGQAKWVVPPDRTGPHHMSDRYPHWAIAFRDRNLDSIMADGRNHEIVCELAHRQIELGRYAPAPNPHLIAFAEELGLTHLLPTEAEAA